MGVHTTMNPMNKFGSPQQPAGANPSMMRQATKPPQQRMRRPMPGMPDAGIKRAKIRPPMGGQPPVGGSPGVIGSAMGSLMSGVGPVPATPPPAAMAAPPPQAFPTESLPGGPPIPSGPSGYYGGANRGGKRQKRGVPRGGRDPAALGQFAASFLPSLGIR
jgi:hypothetical protein